MRIFRLREKLRRSVLGRMKSSQEASSKREVSAGEGEEASGGSGVRVGWSGVGGVNL